MKGRARTNFFKVLKKCEVLIGSQRELKGADLGMRVRAKVHNWDKRAIALIDANVVGTADGRVPVQSHLHLAPVSFAISNQNLLLSLVDCQEIIEG